MARMHCGTQLICIACSVKLLISIKNFFWWLSTCLPLLQEEAENTKFALEQKIQELESRSSSSSSSYVSTPGSGRVQQTAAQQQLLLQHEEQRQLAQQELQKQLADLQEQATDVQKQNEELLASRCVPHMFCLLRA